MVDGDTFAARVGTRMVKVRVADIDAPEDGQDGGEEATRALAELLGRDPITLVERGTDRHGRTLARVRAGEVDVSAAMVSEGHAWHAVRYSDDRSLASLERDARAARRGLWRSTNPVAPWVYRAPKIPPVLPLPFQPEQWSQSRPELSPVQAVCGSKRVCNQMASCDEAVQYLQQCGMRGLDRDGDGTPCDTICG